MGFSQEFYESIIDRMLNAFALHRILLDEKGNPCDYEFIAINPAFEDFTGMKKADIVGKRYTEAIPVGKNDSTDWISIYGDVALNGKAISFESYTAVFKKWVAVNAYCPEKGYFITIFSDITDLKNKEQDLKGKNEELLALYEELIASEEELRYQLDEISCSQEKLTISEERFRLATEGSNDIIWDVDIINNKFNFPQRLYDLLGYEKEGSDMSEGLMKLVHPDDRKTAQQAWECHFQGKTSFYNCEYRIKKANGNYIWVYSRGKALQDIHGRFMRFAGSLTDITEKVEYENKLKQSYQDVEAINEELLAAQEELNQQNERLQQIAYRDPLTGLPNRIALYEKLSVDLTREPVKMEALLLIDIDNFKMINDTMGHSFGDQLIIDIGKRISDIVDHKDIIYRPGGDEFIILGCDISAIEEVHERAVRIIQSFRNPFYIMDSTLHASASIGIAIYPDHGISPDELFKCADIAMYKAKESGRNGHVIYNEHMQEIVIERMNLEKHLRTAIDRSELELYYQPQIEVETGEICGFEALLRWNSPELGFVSPLRFIKVAEDSQLIIPIGEWVLRNACFFLKKLHSMGYGHLTMGVNISIIQILQDGFVQTIMNLLNFIQLEPQYLELEITESIFMQSYGDINHKLEQLRRKGIKIALDDFGQGYSSLGNLHYLPIDTLKIDKCFIDSIGADKPKESIADMIILIGRKMELTVLAEGVETQEQRDYLAKNNCHKIQGYLFGKPVPKKEVLKMLTGKETMASTSALEWKAEYNMDIEKIDAQHKEMFDIGKRISKLLFDNDNNEHSQEISIIIKELKQYTENHFLLEEQFMKENNYIHYHTHKTEHEFIIQKLAAFEDVPSGNMQNEMLTEMIDFVFVWISDHILYEDMKYKNHLSKLI